MSATSTTLPKFDSTEGCLFLAAIFSSVLWGIGCAQTYLYYETYGKADKRWLKLYVFVVWCLDTVHSILLLKAVYVFLVADIGDVAALGESPRVINETTMFTALVDFLVQLIFIYRTWSLSNKNRPLVSCFLFLATGEFVVAVIAFARTLGVTKFADDDSSVLPVTRAAAAIGVFVDTTLALTLIVLQRRRREELTHMNSIVDRMSLSIGTGLFSEAWSYLVGSGLITGGFALAGLVASFASPDTFIFILFLEMLPKLYYNCLLTSLNMRHSLKVNGTSATDVELMKFATRSASGGGPRPPNFNESISQTMEVKVERNAERYGDQQQFFHPSLVKKDVKRAQSDGSFASHLDAQ